MSGWSGRNENQLRNQSKRMLNPHEYANQLLQIFTGLQQDGTEAAREIGLRTADRSSPKLAKQIGDRLPRGWEAVWVDTGI